MKIIQLIFLNFVKNYQPINEWHIIWDNVQCRTEFLLNIESMVVRQNKKIKKILIINLVLNKNLV